MERRREDRRQRGADLSRDLAKAGVDKTKLNEIP
jgi:hypothetical protein